LDDSFEATTKTICLAAMPGDAGNACFKLYLFTAQDIIFNSIHSVLIAQISRDPSNWI
jgi:hypothetical protein